MKKLYFLLLILPVIFAVAAHAQTIVENEDYTVPPIALGFRASPDGAGLSGRYFITEPLAIEGQLNGSAGNYYDNGTSYTLGALLEYNFFFANPQWRFF